MLALIGSGIAERLKPYGIVPSDNAALNDAVADVDLLSGHFRLRGLGSRWQDRVFPYRVV